MSTIGYYICVPFAWLVRLFYNLTGSYGVALILFTLVIKLIMLPFQMKSKKSMLRMNRLSGQMKDIQKRYANNQVKMNEEMQKLYAEEGINPMSGCLWTMLPFPILIALYSIIRQPITHFMMLPKSALETLIQTATKAGVNMSNIVDVQGRRCRHRQGRLHPAGLLRPDQSGEGRAGDGSCHAGRLVQRELQLPWP